MIQVVPMQIKHLDAVVKIEADSNIIAWSKSKLLNDFYKPYSFYFVAIKNNLVCGYASMYCQIDAHITNIIVAENFRSIGIGSLLLQNLIDTAMQKNFDCLTLEVKISNIIAQRLYTKFAFKPIALKKNFYPDTNEDAIIMQKYF